MKTSFTEVTLGALLLRRLASSVESGSDLKVAAVNLRGRLSDAMRTRLDSLIAALESPASASRSRARTAFETIIALAHASGADALKSMVRLAHHSERLVPLQYKVDREMGSRYLYLLVVGLVVLMVVVIGNQAIAPLVAELFGNGDHALGVERLPLPTRLVFYTAGGAIGYLLMALLVVPALAWAKFSADARRAIQTLSPLPAHWRRWPIFRRSAARLDHLVMVIVADCLHAGGLSSRAALEAAAGGALPDEPPEVLGLTLASDGVDLDRELAWQSDATGEFLWADVQMLVEQGGELFNTLAGIVVGVIVVAIYLPIFRMGNLGAMVGVG